jgi:hypothetical protein
VPVRVNGEAAEDDYDRFREATAELFAQRRVTLPEMPRNNGDPLLRGVVLFRDDWTPWLATDVAGARDDSV